MVNVTRQSVTLAFCLGDGFTNLLYPTSGIMIIAIGLVGVSYTKWLKFSWPLFVIEGIISVAVMMLAREDDAIMLNHHDYLHEVHMGTDKNYRTERNRRREQYLIPLKENK
jgi:hypothetical protein